MHSVSHSWTVAMLFLPVLVLLCKLLIISGTASMVYNDYAFLNALEFEGMLRFDNLSEGSLDFGHMVRKTPLAILEPASVNDIVRLLKSIYNAGSGLTVAARGHGHSVHGQAQAENGVVIDMSSLRGGEMKIHRDSEMPYVDVGGGELWIDVLRNTLKVGLAPRSWTDYLYLTVGGTLSNAGISGQAFRYGPQISNVYQLQVVTGKGDVLLCSKNHNSDLFYAALGGLGQFGIITRARIALEVAPQRVKWIRVLYSDFDAFTRDQENLISQPQTFDYLEGFVVTKSESLLSNWRSSLFKPLKNQTELAMIQPTTPNGEFLYYLEVAKYYYTVETDVIDEKVGLLLASLQCVPSSIYGTDVSYYDFLNRVHPGELKLRANGLWDIPHPWLNLLVPKSRIADFSNAVFNQILVKGGAGPVLIYPMHRSKWDNRTSAMTPKEDVFYLVALLRSPDGGTTEELIQQNARILRYCKSARIGEKMYLPYFGNGIIEAEMGWRAHYGEKWNRLALLKSIYDPHSMLSPSQYIFARTTTNDEAMSTSI